MGIIKQLSEAKGPAEAIALLRYARQATNARRVMTATLDADWKYSYSALCEVSRSFSLVIMQLNPDLRHPVCVFYLVLRALDSIEDDTSVDADRRRHMCQQFWTFLPGAVEMFEDQQAPGAEASSSRRPCISDQDEDEVPTESKDGQAGEQSSQDWSSDEFGSGAEKELCMRFPQVLRCFRSLDISFRRVIADITRRMGAGMAEHIQSVSCDSIDDYDMYCHYVAGLVGYGLSDIFVASNREHPSLASHRHLSNSMGLFLQKTNVIRDYLEDIDEGRTFWPEEIWSLYADKLEDFRDSVNRKFALTVLNHMVTDALRHVAHCLEYVSSIQSDDVFRFVAIPQVMAIATLVECYNNGKIFEGVVKLRKARTATLVLQTNSMDAVYKIFFDCARRMMQAVEPHDPNAERTKQYLTTVIDLCVPHISAAPNLIIPNVLSIVLFCGLSSYVLKRRQEHFDGAVFTWRSAGGIMEPTDMLAVGALFIVCIYMFGFFLLPYMTKLQQDEWRRMMREERKEDVGTPTPSTMTLLPRKAEQQRVVTLE